MGRRVALAIMLVACGRLSFDPRDDGGADAFVDTCRFTAVGAGESFTCAIDKNAAVWCWGNNDSGQVQPGGPPIVLAGARVALPAAAVEVEGGNFHACARLVDGTVWCWGSNVSGQLGNGTTNPATTPVQVNLGGDTALELDVG